MGCDIHLYREARVDGKWIAAADSEDESDFTGRNYNLFAVLAGVRVDEEPPYKFAARGLPLGVSPAVAEEAAGWGADGHSHSYLYLHELLELRSFLASQKYTVSGMKDAEGLAALEASIASGSPDWSLLYPYCQWTNSKTARAFSVEVPADYLLGKSLDGIIASLQSIGGENQRIVFWFDN